MPAKRWLLWLVPAIGTLIGLQWLLPDAPGNLLGQALHDAAHIPWFALLGWLLCLCFVAAGWSRWLVPPVLVLLALVSEGLQQVPAASDLWLNLVGAAFGWLAWQLRHLRRWWLFVLIASVVATAVQPLRVLSALSVRDAAMPVLFDPAQLGWQQLIGTSGSARWAPEPMTVAGAVQQTLAVDVGTNPWPGIRLRELDQSWQSYQSLAIHLVVTSDEPLVWYVGTRHQGDAPGGATRSQQFMLESGLHQLSVPIAGLTPGVDGASVVEELLLYSESGAREARWHLLKVTAQR